MTPYRVKLFPAPVSSSRSLCGIEQPSSLFEGLQILGKVQVDCSTKSVYCYDLYILKYLKRSEVNNVLFSSRNIDDRCL